MSKIQPNKSYLKVTSLFTLFFFIASSVPGFAVSTGLLDSVTVPNSLVQKLEIPEELGIVKERHVGSEGTVLYIEDAHAQVDAQHNIAGILDHVQKKYGFRTLFLEGGLNGPVSSDLLRFFKNGALNEKIAEELLEKAEASGAGLFLLKKGEGIHAYGVENEDSYRENLLSFQKVYQGKNVTDHFLESFKSDIDTFGSRSLNRDLRKFLKEWLLFNDDKRELLSHLSAIDEASLTFLRLNLHDAKNQLDYPNLIRFFKLKDLEKKDKTFSKEELENEKSQWKAWLVAHQFNPYYTNTSETIFSANQPLNTINVRLFLERFYAQATAENFSFKDYPALAYYFAKFILTQEIDSESLFKEINGLTDKVLNSLAKTDEEKQIIELWNDYLLLTKLFKLELSREELKKIEEKKQAIGPSALSERLQQVTENVKRIKKTSEVYAQNRSALQNIFQETFHFYNLAQAREFKIFQNFRAALSEHKTDKSVLIMGGFHLDGIRQYLESGNFSYVVVSPKIQHIESNQNYINVMVPSERETSNVAQARLSELPLPIINRIAPNVGVLYQNRVKEIYEQHAGELHGIGSALHNSASKKRSEVRTPERNLEIVKEVSKNLAELWDPEIKALSGRAKTLLETIGNDVNKLKGKNLEQAIALAEDYQHYLEAGDEQKEHRKNLGLTEKDRLVYFSMEYGITEDLNIYGGGLGILSGDHVRGASDYYPENTFVAVGPAWRVGYFLQKMAPDGWQHEEYPRVEFEKYIDIVKEPGTDRDLILQVKLPNGSKTNTIFGKALHLKAGRVDMYLITTDIAANDQEGSDRTYKNLLDQLYFGGNRITRLMQEVVTGMMGTQLMERLGIQTRVLHLNEGHMVFSALELVRQEMFRRGRMLGFKEEDVANLNHYTPRAAQILELTFEQSLDAVRKRIGFTSHTPIPAGNEVFEVADVKRYLQPFADSIGLDMNRLINDQPGKESPGVVSHENRKVFNLTEFALWLSNYYNGVSKRHGEVAAEMHGRKDFHYITNSVHRPFWQHRFLQELLEKTLNGLESQEPKKGLWTSLDHLNFDQAKQLMAAISDSELAEAKKQMREEAINFFANPNPSNLSENDLHWREPINFDPNAFTIAVVRRFAPYKRSDLILAAAIANPLIEFAKTILGVNVQIVFAGKAHPNDEKGKRIPQRIYSQMHSPELKGHVFFVPNYDIKIAKYLFSLSDVWLNNPELPMEASGTSGQKGEDNGVVTVSTKDGWVLESKALVDAENFLKKDGPHGSVILFGDGTKEHDTPEYLGPELLKILKKLIQISHDHPAEWLELSRLAIADGITDFGMRRFLEQYDTAMYEPNAIASYKADEKLRIYYDGLEAVIKSSYPNGNGNSFEPGRSELRISVADQEFVAVNAAESIAVNPLVYERIFGKSTQVDQGFGESIWKSTQNITAVVSAPDNLNPEQMRDFIRGILAGLGQAEPTHRIILVTNGNPEAFKVALDHAFNDVIKTNGLKFLAAQKRSSFDSRISVRRMDQVSDILQQKGVVLVGPSDFQLAKTGLFIHVVTDQLFRGPSLSNSETRNFIGALVTGAFEIDPRIFTQVQNKVYPNSLEALGFLNTLVRQILQNRFFATFA